MYTLAWGVRMCGLVVGYLLCGVGCLLWVVWRVACGVWRVACGVWRVACGVWGLGCGMWVGVGVGCGGRASVPFCRWLHNGRADRRYEASGGLGGYGNPVHHRAPVLPPCVDCFSAPHRGLSSGAHAMQAPPELLDFVYQREDNDGATMHFGFRLFNAGAARPGDGPLVVKGPGATVGAPTVPPPPATSLPFPFGTAQFVLEVRGTVWHLLLLGGAGWKESPGRLGTWAVVRKERGGGGVNGRTRPWFLCFTPTPPPARCSDGMYWGCCTGGRSACEGWGARGGLAVCGVWNAVTVRWAVLASFVALTGAPAGALLTWGDTLFNVFVYCR
jgi:hypothetical protein